MAIQSCTGCGPRSYTSHVDQVVSTEAACKDLVDLDGPVAGTFFFDTASSKCFELSSPTDIAFNMNFKMFRSTCLTGI